MTLPRILHRLYAHLRGLPWKACPICKREFGGHERARHAAYWVSPGNSESVCEDCQGEAILRNWKNIVGDDYWKIDEAAARSMAACFVELKSPKDAA